MIPLLQILNRLSSYNKSINPNSTFHLLRLPSLARDEVLETFTSIELFNLSLVSHKMRIIIRSSKNWKKFELRMGVSGCGFAFILSINMNFFGKVFVLAESYRQLFVQVKNLTLEHDLEDDFKKKYYILDNFNVTNNLWIYSQFDFEKLRNSFPSDLNFVSIYHSQHLTMHSLSTLNARIVCLLKSTFNSGNFNCFMKEWVSGAYLRTKYFSCDVLGNLNKRDVFIDINVEEHPITFKRSYSIDNHEAIVFSGGLDISRSDGISATIILNPKGFKMMVWPDAKGVSSI
ncbi:hypothetical protein CRE_09995 [Caenorhabditis remanei]|uniref:Uncharacterized protein n=2 Tax=Caenorhabditis remanei TaxID=31234 RepID=E3M6Q2_CAERE|nr:hypothetical protein CRE_09995 [Caenorhabditis remanei]